MVVRQLGFEDRGNPDRNVPDRCEEHDVSHRDTHGCVECRRPDWLARSAGSDALC